jgi:hypothetical protein
MSEKLEYFSHDRNLCFQSKPAQNFDTELLAQANMGINEPSITEGENVTLILTAFYQLLRSE